MRRVSVAVTIGMGLLLTAVPGRADVASVCDAIAGNLVTNCGFETGNFNGWNVTNNDEFTLVVGSHLGIGADSGGFYADLGTAFQQVTIAQTIAANASTSYVFSFAFASGGGGNFTAMWDNQSLLNLVNAPASPYTEYSFSVTGTGSDTISFISENDFNFDGLDDVAVAPVPEPSWSWLALIPAGLWFSLKRSYPGSSHPER